jgi:hypothetical protein
MTDDLDLGPRLEQLANELTRDALVPPPAAAHRRAGGARPNAHDASTQAAAVAATARRPWAVRRGHPGPATWSTRQAAHLADRVQRSEVRPWRPPVRGPFLHHEAWRQADQLVCVPTGAGWLQAVQGSMGQYPDLDGRPQEPKGPGHLPLRRTLRAADAGPPEQAQRQEGQHRRSLQHHPGQTYKTLRQPTGAQVAIAWNCDAPPASSRRESLLPRGRGPYSRWSRATSA